MSKWMRTQFNKQNDTNPWRMKVFYCQEVKWAGTIGQGRKKEKGIGSMIRVQINLSTWGIRKYFFLRENSRI